MKPIFLFIVIFFHLIWVSGLEAHRVTVFPSIADHTLTCQTYFSGGKGCSECEIKIFELVNGQEIDETKTPIIVGKTDSQGIFVTDIPKVVPLGVVLLAGAGHKATATIYPTESQSSTKKVDSSNDSFINTGLKAMVGLGIIAVFFLIIRRVGYVK